VNDAAIVVERLRKTYRLYRSPGRRFLDLMFGWRSDAREFVALDDVSFAVRRGETLGVLGRNGAGKSTLLAMIAGVLTPSSGTVSVNGRLGALLELGAGFHPDATGRENILLGASLLGLGTAEARARFDSIVAFADIGEHLDQPLRTYSSGMFVRLAFAVHTAFEPDVLIVDEALAVGDAAFQSKCYRRLRELKLRGSAIVLVTHDVQSVRLFCDRALWLDHGRLRMQGEPEPVTTQFLRDLYGGEPAAHVAAIADAGPQVEALAAPQPAIPEHGLFAAADLADGTTPAGAVRWGRGGARLVYAAIASPDGATPAVLEHGRRLRITLAFTCELQPPPDDLAVAFTVKHRKSLEVICETTAAQGRRLPAAAPSQPVRVEFEFDNVLAPDDYTVAAAIARITDGQPDYLDFVDGILPFKVVGEGFYYSLVKPPIAIRI
jgi:lipopolysaccharide transport system ATP-binding protein